MRVWLLFASLVAVMLGGLFFEISHLGSSRIASAQDKPLLGGLFFEIPDFTWWPLAITARCC
jgi:hypothetical protein